MQYISSQIVIATDHILRELKSFQSLGTEEDLYFAKLCMFTIEAQISHF